MQTEPSARMHKKSEAPLNDALCTATSAMISSRFAMNSVHSEGCVSNLFLTLIDLSVNYGWARRTMPDWVREVCESLEVTSPVPPRWSKDEIRQILEAMEAVRDD
jgi:hypothetical protein